LGCNVLDAVHQWSKQIAIVIVDDKR